MASVPMAAPLQQVLTGRGFETWVVAEGLSIGGWKKASVHLLKTGAADPAVEQDTIDCPAILGEVKPDVVIVGAGARPINLEKRMAVSAQELSIPVILLEDYWGGHTRFGGIPLQLVLTIDWFASVLAAKAFPDAQVEVVGDGAVLKEIAIAAELIVKMNDLRRRFRRIDVWASGGYHGDLALLLQGMRQHMSKRAEAVLIPLIHPKVVNFPSGGMKLGERLSKMIEDSGVVVDWLADVPRTDRFTEQVVAQSDAVYSGFSKVLTTAAFWNKPCGALASPDGFEMLGVHGLSALPHVELGLATKISKPNEILSTEPPGENRLKLKPYDPVLAADCIEAFVWGIT